MMMCSMVQAALEEALHTQTIADLDTAELAHIRTCSHCDTFASVLMAEELRRVDPALTLPFSCAEVEAALPAAIDGGDLTAPSFNHIRGHLLQCAECHYGYTLLRELDDIAATLTDVPAVLPNVRVLLLPISVLEWSRAVLNELVRLVRITQPHFVTRSKESLPPSVAKHIIENHIVKLHAVEQPDGQWTLIVTTEPPLSAIAVVAFANQEFRGPFDGEGRATFDNIPGTLLTDPNGPSLVLRIE